MPLRVGALQRSQVRLAQLAVSVLIHGLLVVVPLQGELLLLLVLGVLRLVLLELLLVVVVLLLLWLLLALYLVLAVLGGVLGP